jgi:hypothetical protein
MRRKILYGFVALAVLGAVLSAGKLAASLPEASQGPRVNPPTLMLDPEDPKDWSANGLTQIHGIIEKLQTAIDKIPPTGPLTSGMVTDIVNIYGANGIMTGHDGATYRGTREISMYLRQLALCSRITDFRIEIRVVYAKEFTDLAKLTKGSDNDVIHSVYFILNTSYKINGVPVDPPSSTSCPHIRVCECDRSK